MRTSGSPKSKEQKTTRSKHAWLSDDVCANCGAELRDGAQGRIGCEAQKHNPISYLGFAVTVTEQAAGLEAIDKMAWLFAQGSMPFDEFEQRRERWRELSGSDLPNLAREAKVLGQKAREECEARHNGGR